MRFAFKFYDSVQGNCWGVAVIQSSDLTFLIPAFKSQFLVELLDSLCAQTVQGFRVIVADDASPNDVASVIDPYVDRLRVSYVRFDRNLGGTDLAGHWNRALALVDTPWVTLPGDDDLLGDTFVESTLRAIDHTEAKFSVYRARSTIIDASGREIGENNVYPGRVSIQDYLFAHLNGSVGYLVDHVFSTAALRAAGGFVTFPLAWWADVATLCLLGFDTGIWTIPEGEVRYRMSDANISASRPELVGTKYEATLQWLEWLHARRRALDIHMFDDYAEAMLWRIYPSLQEIWPKNSFDFHLHSWRYAGRLACLHRASRIRHYYRYVASRSVNPRGGRQIKQS